MKDMNEITAKVGKDGANAAAVNPGGWWSKTFLIQDDTQNSWVVEADSMSDAIEELIESPHGVGFHIKGSENASYGWPNENDPGEPESWTDLDGTVITDPKIGKYLSHPSVSGDGTYYDDSSMYVEELDPKLCVYVGEGLPKKGLNATQYNVWQDLDEDTKEVLMEVKLSEDPIDIAVKVHELAKEKYKSLGFENALAYMRREYGADASVLFKLAGKAVAGLDCNSDIFNEYKDEFNRIRNKAQVLRDPTCYVTLLKDLEGVPYYRFTHNQDYATKHYSDIKDAPVSVQFTFERLLVELKEKNRTNK